MVLGRITASKIYEAARCKTVVGVIVESVGVRKLRETEVMKKREKISKWVLLVIEKQEKIKPEVVGLILSNKHPTLEAFSY